MVDPTIDYLVYTSDLFDKELQTLGVNMSGIKTDGCTIIGIPTMF